MPGKVKAKQTHCRRGHPLQGRKADVRIYTDPAGYTVRICRACDRIRDREARERRETNITHRADYYKNRGK